jgi:hypothetical protein
MRKVEDNAEKSARSFPYNLPSVSRLKTRTKRRTRLLSADIKAFFTAVWTIFKMLRFALLVLIVLAILLHIFLPAK